MMRVLVVYGSMYGNPRIIAGAIGAGLGADPAVDSPVSDRGLGL
jgi:flavodoxin